MQYVYEAPVLRWDLCELVSPDPLASFKRAVL